MNPNLSPKLINLIESLCSLGCSQVNDVLSRARSGQSINELSELSVAEKEQVLEELDQIMSVYDDSSGENPSADFKPEIK
jgi:hypothetical protein